MTLKKTRRKNNWGAFVLLALILLYVIFSNRNKGNSDSYRSPQNTYETKTKYYENAQIKYAGSSLNIREKPNISSKIIGGLDIGESIYTTNNIQNDFQMVLKKDYSFLGWCAVKYLQSSPIENTQSNKNINSIKYTIYSKEDISFTGLKRMVYRIELNVEIVPEETELKNSTIEIWKNGNKHWDDFTIFYYLPDMDKNGSAFTIAEFTPYGLKSFTFGRSREAGSKIVIPKNLDKEYDASELICENKSLTAVQELIYVQKELNGWKYSEVITIPTTLRQKIFYDLVKYQDDTCDDEGARSVIAHRYNYPIKAIGAIAIEGALKKWQTPPLN